MSHYAKISRAPALRTLALIAALAAAVAGCTHPQRFEAKPLPAAQQEAVREQVRGFAKAHCGTCHQSSRPTALPAALAIYDLDTPLWSAKLTAAQLRGGFPRRLNSSLDAAGQQQLRAFIESELALRRE